MKDKELLNNIQLYYRLSHRDLPTFSRIDGYLLNNNNEIQMWVERKTRNVTFDAYPDIVVDSDKFFALIDMEEITTIPAVLAYGWSCGTWGIARPSKIKSFIIETLTPSMESVSLNKGVSRDVIKISKSDFEIYKGAK